jgi:hypothetical protein
MGWRGTSSIVAGVCFVLAAQSAAAGVVDTRLLGLTTRGLESGLVELRDRFLDDSVVADREHVGGVLQGPDGEFRFTHGVAPVNRDRVRFRIPVPDDHELIAFWHTHGAPGHHRELFSPDDAALVRETGLPFFLIDPAGTLRVLHPDAPHRMAAAGWAPRSRLRPPVGSARGAVVDEPPDCYVAVSVCGEEV